MAVALHIDQDRYVLDPEADVDRLRSAVIAAARAGRKLVEMVHHRGMTDALITQASRVRSDYVPDREERPGGDNEDVAFVDFELE